MAATKVLQMWICNTWWLGWKMKNHNDRPMIFHIWMWHECHSMMSYWSQAFCWNLTKSFIKGYPRKQATLECLASFVPSKITLQPSLYQTILVVMEALSLLSKKLPISSTSVVSSTENHHHTVLFKHPPWSCCKVKEKTFVRCITKFNKIQNSWNSTKWQTKIARLMMRNT